eukprot:CAMPEP_0174918520 /NCGR_PEP_ID=MMETSP1355-20121228/3122_1 /TAXON_ID=464990 /ORGANISM="Hemiselmis tepida, Strain CCMP443" /LENGTH=456 /DNA_ID=CAMNT_0016163695 /DNA_START=80 /DNA_END=1447 /DNA_ORIENTATION=+
MKGEMHHLELSGPEGKVGELRQKAATALGVATDGSIVVTLILKGNVLKDDAAQLAASGFAENDFIVCLTKKAPAVASAASPAAVPFSPPAAATPPAPSAAPAPAAPAAAAAPAPSPATASGVLISLTVATQTGDIINVEVDSCETVANVKAIVEVETQVPMARQALSHDGKPLTDDQRLDAAGVKDNDMLLLQVGAAARPAAAPRPAGAPGQLPPGGLLGNLFGNFGAPPDPLARYMGQANELVQMAQMDPHLLTRIQGNNPALAEALGKGDERAVAQSLADVAKARAENDMRKQAAIMRLNANPLDVEAQKTIEDAIQQENIDRTHDLAMEYNPESFARVVMLYVNCEVNGTPVKAFVDSGAQMTIMGVKTAEKMGLLRLVDKRYAGVAKGVGTSKILGKCHSVQMKLGGSFFQISVTVLEDNSMDFLFGLDNLRRHQCCIDLKENVLRMGNDAV